MFLLASSSIPSSWSAWFNWSSKTQSLKFLSS
jgi:hypothetical protein